MENPEAYLGRLKPIHIFKGLKDDEILEIAREFEPERRAAGETVFAQDEEGQSFYIINRGRVKVVRKVRGEDRLVAMLVPGDYFGEAALLYGRRRSATVVAETDVELLRLSKEDFDRLLKQYPQIKPNMLVTTESRNLYRSLNISWLGPDEVVYLIARRHKILLYQSIAIPLGLSVLVLIVVAAAWWFMTWQMALILLALGGAPPAAWITWNVVDWSNDYYIVTNKRVVYLEKIVGIYDSRQEAPLHSVLSVSIQTAGSLARSFGIGDVVVRTFSGPITMKSVPNPQALAALIEEHWARTRTREKEAEQEALKTAVRRRVRPEPPKAPAPPAAKPTPPKRPPLRAQVSEFFSFRVRFERGESVIYRKHWYVLLQSIWQPSLFILAALGLIGLKLAGLIPEPVTLAVVVLIALVLFIPFAAWWWYEFEDWKNDIYLVTPDQIVDVSKKPFGQETRKSAPLGNVLSLRYERPGLLGMMLNFGTVIATVAGQEFRFEGVFDPVSVQNDIYRRMEAMNAKKAQAETAKRRDEMADLIGAYQAVLNEISEDAKKQKPPLNPT
ncbi:MAG: Cyclic nucleotide-binding protein [Anaerolineales bacterium]|nr:Cyclic nucleotide-binding protein [Anaerolineales bacterium]